MNKYPEHRIPLHLVIAPTNLWRIAESPALDFIKVETINGRTVSYFPTNKITFATMKKSLSEMVKAHNLTVK